MALLRVLVVTSHLIPRQNSVWDAAADLVDELHLAGSLVSDDTGGGRPATGIAERATTHVFTPRDLTGRGPLWWVYPGLGTLIRELRPDVVHVHSEAWSLLSLQALRSGRPTVLHGADNRFVHGNPLEAAIRRRIARSALRRAAGYASWNTKGVELARSHGLRPSCPTTVAPAGVSWPLEVTAEDAADLRAFWRAKPKVVAFAGRLVADKGLDWLFSALSGLGRDDVTVVIAGDGPARAQLEAQAASLGLDVRFLGGLPEEGAVRVLAAADLVVLPSRTTRQTLEQFGRAASEAMSAGTPLIVSDSGALPEVVGSAGIVVPEDDVAALATAIATVLDDPAAARALAGQGRARYDELHRPDRVAARLTTLWESVSAPSGILDP